MTPEEVSLVGRAREGDAEAQRQIFERYHNIVFATAYARLGNREDARDVVQEAFLRAFRGIGRLERNEAFGRWLLSIAENRCASFLRKRMNQGPREPLEEGEEAPGAGASPEALLSGREDHSRILRIVRELPEHLRTPLLLRYLDGLTCRQIAERTGATPGSVRVTLHRAIGHLRSHLGLPAVPEAKPSTGPENLKLEA